MKTNKLLLGILAVVLVLGVFVTPVLAADENMSTGEKAMAVLGVPDAEIIPRLLLAFVFFALFLVGLQISIGKRLEDNKWVVWVTAIAFALVGSYGVATSEGMWKFWMFFYAMGIPAVAIAALVFIVLIIIYVFLAGFTKTRGEYAAERTTQLGKLSTKLDAKMGVLEKKQQLYAVKGLKYVKRLIALTDELKDDLDAENLTDAIAKTKGLINLSAKVDKLTARGLKTWKRWMKQQQESMDELKGVAEKEKKEAEVKGQDTSEIAKKGEEIEVAWEKGTQTRKKMKKVVARAEDIKLRKEYEQLFDNVNQQEIGDAKATAARAKDMVLTIDKLLRKTRKMGAVAEDAGEEVEEVAEG